MTYLKHLLGLVWNKLLHEPVAVWGTVLAAIMGVLSQYGVSAGTVQIIGSVAAFLGIPIVRGFVSPVQALKELAAAQVAVDTSPAVVPALDALPEGE